MEAASAASASPSVRTSRKSSGFPAPPEAITGIFVARETVLVSSRSNPPWTPSVSIEVSRISPAPSASARTAHSMASMPSSSRPPRVKTCHLPGATRLASMASTVAWEPNSRLSSVSSSGRRTAAVFTETLSAPAMRILRAS